MSIVLDKLKEMKDAINAMDAEELADAVKKVTPEEAAMYAPLERALIRESAWRGYIGPSTDQRAFYEAYDLQQIKIDDLNKEGFAMSARNVWLERFHDLTKQHLAEGVYKAIIEYMFSEDDR